MLRLSLLFFIAAYASCNSPALYVDQIENNKFCQYFKVDSSNVIKNGHAGKAFSLKIDKISGDDPVLNFINAHSLRFDYLGWKCLGALLTKQNPKNITEDFCTVVSSNNFYLDFILLTSGPKKDTSKNKESYSQDEMMLIASRFFMCVGINPSDTSISYHICVGINGIASIKAQRNYTALEAFCFEAIFKNLNGKPVFQKNFDTYIKQSLLKYRQNFPGFQQVLVAVREDCYASMQQDEALKKMLLAYLKKNAGNLNFLVI